MGIKSMIQRCIERMRASSCATCDNRQICPAGRWQQASFALRNGKPGTSNQQVSASGMLAFLGQIAASLDIGKTKTRHDVERSLNNLLPSGDISIDRVASELGLSRQTLYRRLKAEGTTFEELLEATRRKLAMLYLKREGLSVKSAAYRLGFSEPAAFSRAFKRWTGTSPSSVR